MSCKCLIISFVQIYCEYLLRNSLFIHKPLQSSQEYVPIDYNFLIFKKNVACQNKNFFTIKKEIAKKLIQLMKTNYSINQVILIGTSIGHH